MRSRDRHEPFTPEVRAGAETPRGDMTRTVPRVAPAIGHRPPQRTGRGSAWHLVHLGADAVVGRVSDARLAQAMSASSGTCSFQNITLTLNAHDDRVWQINAYVPPGEPMPGARRLVINGPALDRK